MKAKNTYLITQPVFGFRVNSEGKKLIHHSCVINFGEELEGGRVKFTTRDGEQIKNIHSLDNSIKVFKMDDICLENFMSKWKRINKDSKPIILDESIETEEIFQNDFSPLKIMIERRSDCIAIKPLFNL
jgi:hypothetical protein